MPASFEPPRSDSSRPGGIFLRGREGVFPPGHFGARGGRTTLVFISDLHLNDETGGRQSLRYEAFDGTLKELGQVARDARAEEIVLVLLGDIFDMVRTTGWLVDEPRGQLTLQGTAVPVEERPWGRKEALNPKHELAPATLQRAKRILKRIEETNQRSLDLLKSGTYLQDFDVTRVFVPGNHDRICDQHSDLRAMVAGMLAIPEPPGHFAHHYCSNRYRTFARHGHEWDPMNIELPGGRTVLSANELKPADYMAVPFGEAIACEVASKIGPLVYDALMARNVEPGEVEAIFGAIDDVRPLAAIIPYLLSAMNRVAHRLPDGKIFGAIQDALVQVARELGSLEFTQAWLEKHRWTLRAQLTQWAIVLGMERVLHEAWALVQISRPVQRLFSLFGDNYAHGAMRDLRNLNRRKGSDYLYLLYGHTHCPEQMPLDADANRRPRVYMNTGTWRRHVRQGLSGGGYMPWHSLTYTIVYGPDEHPQRNLKQAPGYPTFEAWTGALLDQSRP